LRSRASQRVVRVVVADDHPLYREGVVGAVKARPDLELVGEASNGAEALKIIAACSPDVALLDVKMQVEGPSVLSRLKAAGSPTAVVFLSAYLDSPLVYAALEAGAAGFLSKAADRVEICDALHRAARGEVVLSPETQTLLGREIRLKGPAERPSLTSREHEVLALAAEGLSAAAIGARLFLSPATVKTHLAHVYDKLGVSDRAAAVAEAFRRGILT
jgi:two-component system, NarL family, nitrate/nitrite response regulator NarL